MYFTRIETTGRDDDVFDFGEETRILTLTESTQRSHTQNDEIWSYSVQSNTWRRILRSGSTVKFDGSGRFVTMCRNSIVWIDDYVENEVWMFDGIKELWLKIYIVQTNASSVPISASTSAVLSVSIPRLDKNRTCDCNEFIIALNLTGRVDMARAMWRQSCFNTQGSYFERLDFDILPDPNTDVGYPVDIAGNTAVSGKSEGLILVIAPSTGLWQYDGKENCWFFRGNFSTERSLVKVNYYYAAYFQKTRVYDIVLFFEFPTTNTVFVFSLKSGEWLTYPKCGDASTLLFNRQVATLVDEPFDRLYLYDLKKEVFQFSLVANKWIWTKIHSPIRTFSPQILGVALLNKDSIYHLSGYRHLLNLYSAKWKVFVHLWRLDLTTMQWTHLFGLHWKTGDDKGAVLHGDVLLFTHFTKSTDLCSVIGYVISENKLVHYENNAISDSVPPWREEYSLVALNSTSLFLCGGVRGDREIMSDSWILSVHSPESETVEWRNLINVISALVTGYQSVSVTAIPTYHRCNRRYGHTVRRI